MKQEETGRNNARKKEKKLIETGKNGKGQKKEETTKTQKKKGRN